MPSINLLPENFTIEAYKKKEKVVVYILAVCFLLVSCSVCAWAEVGKQNEEKDAARLDKDLAQVKKDIKYNVEQSDLLSSEYNRNDVEKLLKNHIYLSKGMNFLKSIVMKDAYLGKADIAQRTDGDFDVKLEIHAKDYDALMSQLFILQDSFWIKSVKIGDINTTKDADASTSADLVVRKDLFVYHDQYWDFGLENLAANCNRYIEIDNYSVVLQNGNSKNTNASSVVVTFDGKTYDSVKLDELESALKKKNDIVKEIKINRTSSADNKPGVVSFHGSMTLKY